MPVQAEVRAFQWLMELKLDCYWSNYLAKKPSQLNSLFIGKALLIIILFIKTGWWLYVQHAYQFKLSQPFVDSIKQKVDVELKGEVNIIQDYFFMKKW